VFRVRKVPLILGIESHITLRHGMAVNIFVDPEPRVITQIAIHDPLKSLKPITNSPDKYQARER
jgi:hypothetical protein